MKLRFKLGLALWAMLSLLGCASTPVPQIPPATSQPMEETITVQEDGWYSTKEEVAEYLETYGHLPENYITKKEAQALGWDNAKGNLWDVAEGKSIGGDRFGNREGLLPEQAGRSYTECDINTDGADSRGAERLIFSNDGLYFYTSDHYASFTELTVDGGTVVWSR